MIKSHGMVQQDRRGVVPTQVVALATGRSGKVRAGSPSDYHCRGSSRSTCGPSPPSRNGSRSCGRSWPELASNKTDQSHHPSGTGENLCTAYVHEATPFNLGIKRLRWELDHRKYVDAGADVLAFRLSGKSGSLKIPAYGLERACLSVEHHHRESQGKRFRPTADCRRPTRFRWL